MDDQPQRDGNVTAPKPNSPPKSGDSPHRKRLLTNPNPNRRSATASPESTLSSDSSSDRLAKKTRDLPNLSDCHRCGLRINYTNPKDRLRPIDSMWRVVLLCKKCSRSISSAEVCSYCFSGSLESDCFKCRACQRRIHKNCVGNCGGFAPWSYFSSGSSNSVCADCWVPEAVVKLIRVRRRKSRKRKRRAVSEQPTLPDTTGVSSANRCQLMEETVKDANCAVEKKIAAVAQAKENALRRAVLAKNAVEIAKGALDFVATDDEKSMRKVVDDAELAFRLHRAINSSPRISRRTCLLNQESLALREARPSTVASSKLEDCGDIKSSERTDRSVSESSVCLLKASDCAGAMINTETIANGNDEPKNEEEGKCNVKPDRYMLKYQRIGKTVSRPSVFAIASDCASGIGVGNLNVTPMSDTGTDQNDRAAQTAERRCDENPNRYMLKYQKRSIKSKTALSCDTKFICCLQNREADPCYL